MRIPRTSSLLRRPCPALGVAAAVGAFLLLLMAAGCDQETAPSGEPVPIEGAAEFSGLFDGREVVLQTIETGPEYARVRLELVATALTIDDADQIGLDVALRNDSSVAAYAPIRLFVGRFQPETVQLLNGDEQLVDPAVGAPEWPLPHFFDYSSSVGDDGILSPGETSEARSWRFADPGLLPFSFAAVAEFGLEPTRPVLAGHVFLDMDQDGVLDPDDPPGYGRAVRVTRPDGTEDLAPVGIDGAWRVPIEEPGLYAAELLLPPTLQFAPVCFTTPNPLHVLVPPMADGTVSSFLHADFGIDPEPCLPNRSPGVELTREPLEALPSDPFRLLGVDPDAAGHLELKVGFSGCSPDHPFRLVAHVPFEESMPPQTWLKLLHDDRGELCEAAFEQSLVFDLGPLLRFHHEHSEPGTPLLLKIEDPATAEVFSILLP